MQGEEEVQSAGRLVVPKFPDAGRDEKQGPSSSGKNPRQYDGQGGSRRSEKPMKQEPDQAEKEDAQTTKLRQAGCPAWTSTSSATLKTAQTR